MMNQRKPQRQIVPLRPVPRQSHLDRQLERVPPHDAEAEACVLGSMMLDSKAAKIAVEALTEEDFYTRRHKMIFTELARMFAAGELIDELLVRNALHVAGTLAVIGGVDMLSGIIDGTHSAANVEAYIKAVKDHALRRAIITVSATALQSLNDGDKSPDTILEEFRTQTEQLSARSQTVSRHASYDDMVAQIEQEITGARFDYGWPWEHMSASASMIPGNTNVICGRAGDGKSFLVFNLLWHWFFKGYAVSSLSLEMDRVYHFRRVLAQLSTVGATSELEWVKAHPERARELYEKYGASMKELEAAMVFQTPGIYERPTVAFILAWLRSEIARGVKVFVIDPITNMQPSRAGRLADEEILVREISLLMSQSQCVCVLVTHPKTSPGGVRLRPSLDNMSGSQAFARFVASIFWLNTHSLREDVMVSGLGVPTEYDREIYWLKVKSRRNEGKRVAFKFNFATLNYEEIGVIRDDD